MYFEAYIHQIHFKKKQNLFTEELLSYKGIKSFKRKKNNSLTPNYPN